MSVDFLPVCQSDVEKRGWEGLDFIIISGDAYVDHPSFGVAIISRLLEANGFKVGIIAQPNWRDLNDFCKLGKPNLAFLITSGNIDSMVNHYTVAKKRRKVDVYSPGGKIGLRPDRASIVYANKAKEAYKDVPIILGGIEPSLRRLAHYDYWNDKVRRSILLDAKADLLVYGMAEQQIIEIADALANGISIEYLTYLRGTVYKTNDLSGLHNSVFLAPFKTLSSKKAYAKNFMLQYRNATSEGNTLVEPYEGIYVIQNPPPNPLSKEQLDSIYLLPFNRKYHPMYESQGGVPAIEEVRFSLTSSRGCFGGCSFCALTFHQGRVIQARSIESILNEAEILTKEPDFKGYINDVGGPTANFRIQACEHQKKHGVCAERECLSPNPCSNLIADHSEYLTILRNLRELPKVKKVFVRSGIRYDYLLYDKKSNFLEELCKHHISGQLKVAPEHVVPYVLNKMGKPGHKIYDKFAKKYNETNKRLGLQQYLVPYLMSSHPGADLQAAVTLAEYLKDIGHTPQQVQDFYPTPGTMSTCMYYCELDPRTMKPIYVAKSPHDKALQRALLQFKDPKNYKLVKEALIKAKRKDLIGYSPKCLIKP